MSNENEENSFWRTLPGILTGIAAIITAITGLIIALSVAGIITIPHIFPTPNPTPTSLPTSQPLPSGITVTATSNPIVNGTVLTSGSPVTPTSPAGTEILGTTWTLVGNHGDAQNDTVIPADSLAGMTSVQVTFNLHGTSFGRGDDEASIVFVQNGDWRAANVILFHAQNGLDGFQTVTIPISSFHKFRDPNITLDPNQPVSNIHARFWNNGAFTVDL